VPSGPGDHLPLAWASPGHYRTSHADRESVIGLLQDAFVQGRLDKDELDTRVSQVFAARTYAELAAITADIPAGLTRASRPAKAVTPAREATVWSIGATFVAATLVASTFLDPASFLLVAGIVFGIVFAAGAQLLYARHEQRSRGHRPLGPG
jgi:hypothetical protein